MEEKGGHIEFLERCTCHPVAKRVGKDWNMF
jgi:hypothetical protein